MPKTLLVVDESKTIREAARLVLASDGWAVTEASSTADAFRELVNGSPDAVLCDAGLAGEGYGFCREIRGIPQAREIPILLMGAEIDDSDAAAAGVGATLPKPFSSDELSNALAQGIEFRSMNLGSGGEPGWGDEEPLTLNELSDSSAEEATASASDEAVEIIDLSGDEDFEELEIVEDLEPVELAPLRSSGEPTRRRKSGDSTSTPASFAFEEQTATATGPSADLFEEETAVEVLDLSSAEDLESEKGQELPEDLGFGVTAPLSSPVSESSLPLSSPLRDDEELQETPYSYLAATQTGPGLGSPAAEGEPLGAPLASEGETSPAPDDVRTLAAAVEKSAERAVREALARSLSGETLSPVVERVVERVVWEVVPQLAERLIREAIEKLKSAPPG